METTVDSTLVKNTECGCLDHPANVYLNKTFELTVDHMYECLFENNEFYCQFSRLRNVSGLIFSFMSKIVKNMLKMNNRA